MSLREDLFVSAIPFDLIIIPDLFLFFFLLSLALASSFHHPSIRPSIASSSPRSAAGWPAVTVTSY